MDGHDISSELISIAQEWDEGDSTHARLMLGDLISELETKGF